MMNTLKTIRLAAIFLATGFTAHADSADAVEASSQDTKKIVQNNFVETAQRGIKLSGYVDAGYSYNFNGNPQQKVVPRVGTDTAYKGDFNLYAFKLALEKALTDENKAQAGFRADVMIGEDATYFTDRDQLNEIDVLSMAEDQKGNLWFGTASGLRKFDGKNFYKIEGISSQRVFCIKNDHSGNIWFGTDAGLDKLSGNKFIHYTEKQGLIS